jgi:hypothetical protein
VNVPLVGISFAAHAIPGVVTPAEVVESMAVTEVVFKVISDGQLNETAVALAIVVVIFVEIVIELAFTAVTTDGFPIMSFGTLVPVTYIPATIPTEAGVAILIVAAPDGELALVVTPVGVAVPAGTVTVIELLVTEFTA